MTNASSIPAVSAVTSVVAAPVAVATFTAVPIAEMSNTVMQQSDVQVLNEESSDAIVVKDASTLPGIPRVASDSALVGSHSLQVYAQDYPLSYDTAEDLIHWILFDHSCFSPFNFVY